nr:PREDICTED: G-protein coupled receptor 55-like isoform X2 [Lepisosteus oculatus]
MNISSNCTPTITEGVRTLLTIIYIPTFILGVLGNVTVLVIFVRGRRHWNDMMTYMTNISIADCFVLISLPFKIYSYYSTWTLPSLCFVFVSSYYVNMYVSIQTVTAISVVRYIAIKYPFKAQAIMSPWKALIVCILIWVLNCTVSSQFHLVDAPENPNKTDDDFRCFQKNTKKPLPLPFILILEIVGFLLPFSLMTFSSLQVIRTLSKQKQVGEKTQCIRIITTNLTIFAVCFIPFHLGFLLKYIIETHAHDSCDLLQGIHNFVHISMCIANTNCCLDSFCYYFVTKDFWKSALCCSSSPKELLTNKPSGAGSVH